MPFLLKYSRVDADELVVAWFWCTSSVLITCRNIKVAVWFESDGPKSSILTRKMFNQRSNFSF